MITDDAGPLTLKRAVGCIRLDSNSARCRLTKRVAIDLNDGNDVATIATSREVWLNGGHGNDRYNAIGTDAPSRVDFDGGFGVDVASYFFGSAHADVLTGTQREQRLVGFDGDDMLSGGPAQDVLEGGSGNDSIDSRDGELDTVDCGGQLLDRATADPAETSILGCAEVLAG